MLSLWKCPESDKGQAKRSSREYCAHQAIWYNRLLSSLRLSLYPCFYHFPFQSILKTGRPETTLFSIKNSKIQATANSVPSMQIPAREVSWTWVTTGYRMTQKTAMCTLEGEGKKCSPSQSFPINKTATACMRTRCKSGSSTLLQGHAYKCSARAVTSPLITTGLIIHDTALNFCFYQAIKI